MKFLWQQRVALLVSALLSVTPEPTFASSFVLPTSGVQSSTFGRKNGRYNALLHVSGGDGDSLNAGNQEDVESADTNLAPNAPPANTTPSASMLGPNAKSPPGFVRAKLSNLPWRKLPDYLTYARCLAIPVFVALFYADLKGKSHIYTGTIFALASVTDWLDGFLARRWDISTAFGAFLDPVADKLMVSTSLILLSGRYGAIAAIPTLIILAREIAVSALREWMAQRGERDAVKVGYQGKVKTALTMFALTMLLYVPASAPTSAILYRVGIPLLYMSAVITITSGSVYFIAAAPALLNRKQ